jgi:hypothetical protein
MPGPQPSATFVISLSALPIGAGMMVALAAVARPKANAAPRTVVFIMLQLSPVSKPSRTHSRSGIGEAAKLTADLAKARQRRRRGRCHKSDEESSLSHCAKHIFRKGQQRAPGCAAL